ncbi:hypothetical protein IGK47_002622 [Enterococcus sp. AZ007]
MLSEIEVSLGRRKNMITGEKQTYEYNKYRKPPN